MAILISDLYGKEIITTAGNKIGSVEDIILDFESGSVASLLLDKMENISRAERTAEALKRKSVNFGRVKSVSETIIVKT
ncbi:MAG: PRC-barrel domain-containing protein [Candidatus Micrarchaeales archaeon]|jgi:sporulation protein YlmC with PRC-barrel domain|uniref:PRC-barrel domain-containing protein n=1 Tax=Candidatus Micrarchaeum acidiphilum ARMAN-2 TaxID=425595 RepID=C7DI05_MICA2|nr:MAG: hypothetical protein UNLARM2_1030 [Candidatus Micrarchaeum acidiphilum ARMAN-2]MCW6160826.1 PRC-barrel domain-containing protein [Candidatus Micrarchaeales archaeon]